MLRIFLVAAFALASVCAEGEFVVLQSPESVEFKGTEPLNQSMVKDLITAILGFTVHPHQSWSGVTIKDPFALPEAAVIVVIEDVDSLGSSKHIKFALNDDESEEKTWQDVKQRLGDRDKSNKLIRIRVGDGSNALGQSSNGELKLNDIEATPTYLISTNEADNEFIRDELIQLLREIAQNIPSNVVPNSKPDVYWLIVSGLGRVINSHGKDSLAAKEAFELLNEALDEIRHAFTKVYKDKVFIAALASDSNKVRNTRSIQSSRVRRATEENETESTSEKNNMENDDASVKVKSKMDEDEIIFREGEGNDNETSENLGTFTESSNILLESTESLSRELNHLTPEIHSMTGGENIDKPVKLDEINLAKKYSKDYPAIFNIILWFGVIFVFSLLAICITIADMDPGRDSIIYRMTSNRMKKDN